MKNAAKLCWFLTGGLTLLSTCASADEQPDVDGTWTGKTQCPPGITAITIQVKGDSGTLSHGGFGPERVSPLSYPIKLAFVRDREGSKVYFKAVNPKYYPFEGINGLLSPDGHQLDVRSQASLGDCKPFVLSRAQAPVSKPTTAKAAAGAVPGREPTEAEMREAVEQQANSRFSSPINTLSVYVVDFKKQGCQKSAENQGYICDYYVETGQEFHSTENSAAGRGHGGAVNGLVNGMVKAAGANKVQVQGRFLYVPAQARWQIVGE
ncbi:hypothetical protein D3C81_70040 [compost metagenome]